MSGEVCHSDGKSTNTVFGSHGDNVLLDSFHLYVRQFASCILGTWRCCGEVDNVSYVQGSAQALVIIHHTHVSTASLRKGWGV